MEKPALKTRDLPRRSWHAVTIMNDVFDRMVEWRARWEKEVGMKLSWTKLFELVLADDVKRREKNGHVEKRSR